VSTVAPHRAIYRRWRAQTFAQLIGQDATVTTLRNAVRTGRLAHGLLFVGPRGTGKTSAARIVAKAVNCLAPIDGEPCDACVACVAIREGTALDVVEMDAASNNRVEDMRDFLPRVWTTPSDLRRKVFIIDEVQRIKDGWDVLLKTLEEPPDHVIFVFCTTDAGGVRPAVLSRLQRFDFTRISEDAIAGKLRMILAADGREADDDAVAILARLADGGMRDAESMLDQLLSGGSGPLTADRVRDLLGLAEEESVVRYIAALADGDPLPGIVVLDGLEERGRDLRAFLDQCVEALRRAIVVALESPAGRVAVPLADRPPAALAAAARRLVDIDPARLGRGGIRFALELALLGGASSTAPAVAVAGVVPTRPAIIPTATIPISPTAPAARREPQGGPATTPATPDAATPAPPARPGRVAADATPATPDAATPDAATPDAATPDVATPDVATSAPPGDLDLEVIRAAWPRIVAYVGESPAAKPVIAACAPIAVEDGVVTVAFPEAQAFFREIAEKRRQAIESGFARALDRKVAVRFVASNVMPAAPAAEPDAGLLLAEARRIFADELVDVPDVD